MNQHRLPTFRSSVLEDFCRRLEKRTKSLKHSGVSLSWAVSDPEEQEWVLFCFKTLAGMNVILELTEGNFADLTLRSNGRQNRGKVLYSLYDITIVGNAEKLLEAIEATIEAVSIVRSTEFFEPTPKMEKAWNAVVVRVYGE